MLFIILLVVGVVLIDIVVSKFHSLNKSPIKRVLYLREITSPPSSMSTLPGEEHKNPFTAEFLFLFDHIGNILDYAVMKYVGNDVRILSRQEGKHAVLHLAAAKERKSNGQTLTRWKWFLWIADFLLLRCGRPLGINLTTHIESSVFSWLFFPLFLPFVKNGLSNLFVFHGMEEVEHGALTVKSLRRQTNPIISLLTFPVVFIIYSIFLLCPPIFVIILNPRLLLLPKSYLDLLLYNLSFGIAFIVACLSQVVHCILPFHENQTLFTLMYQFFISEMKERGITFKVVDQETYKLY